MSNKKHLILCSGSELNMNQMIAIQELLQENHGFANYHYPTNKSAKYLTVVSKFHSDSRDNSVYNVSFEVTTNSGSVGHQQFVHARKSKELLGCSHTAWVRECEEKGYTYEEFDGSVWDAIHKFFPTSELDAEYRYCSAFLSRWATLIYGEARGDRHGNLTQYTAEYIAKHFPTVPHDQDMYCVAGTAYHNSLAQRFRCMNTSEDLVTRKIEESDFDKIPNIICGVKGDDGYMFCEIHKRDEGLVFKGKIVSQYQLSVILDSVGIKHGW